MTRHAQARLAGALMALLTAVFTPICGSTAAADGDFMLLASTTSTENSGLFRHILPLFTRESGLTVRVIAKGTGQAIRIAQNGDADALLVHDLPSEDAFVRAGHGIARHKVMYNDFVLVGPSPLGLRGAADAPDAFRAIAKRGALFVSRGDESGTHKAELRLWRAAAIDPRAASGGWYREAGAGMGATINVAAGMGAYTLADRATWLAHKNKGMLSIVFEGDARLFNQYAIIAVNPDRHPGINSAAANRFIGWLIGPRGQAAIGTFRIDGRQVFFPNAQPESAQSHTAQPKPDKQQTGGPKTSR